MLIRGDYSADFVDTVRRQVRANVESYADLRLDENQREAFETGYVHSLLLALDSYFAHRDRGREGSDGDPLNELRMITDSLRGDDGHGPIVPVLVADPAIAYEPESSVLGIAVGDTLAITIGDYTRLAEAFLDEIEKHLSPQA